MIDMGSGREKTTTFTWTTFFHLYLYIKAYYSIKYTPQEHYFPTAGISLLKKPLVNGGMARKGDWAVRQEGNTCVTVWQDTQSVASISTGHNPASTKVVTRPYKG